MVNVGEVVYLNYGEHPPVTHARLVLHEVDRALNDFVILTPDFDIYTETLDNSNPDVVSFHLAGPNGALPLGVPPGQIYGFAPMAANVLGRYMRDGRIEAQAERARRGLPIFGAVAAPGGAPVAGPVAPAPVAAVQPMVWIFAEMVEGHKVGERVVPPGGVPTLGDYGLLNMTDSNGATRAVLIRQIQEDEIPSFCEARIQLARITEALEGDDKNAADDIRTMAVKYSPNGERRRGFRECVSEMQTVEMADFPYEPRTCLEYLTAIQTVAESAYARHLAWVQQAKLPEGSRAGYEDECLSQILDVAISYDCLQVSNLACFELLVRRKQLLAEAHAYNPNSPNYQGADYWMGTKYRQGGGIVISSLTEHVARKLHADSQILKERRKLEEAKGKGKSLPPKPGGRGQGGGQQQT